MNRALDESIRHWRAVAAGATGISADACALCRASGPACEGCPLAANDLECAAQDSAYSAVRTARLADVDAWRGPGPRTSVQREAVTDMLTLLLFVREAVKGGGA